MEIVSPLSESANVKLVREIAVSGLVDEYSKDLDIDTKRFFHGLSTIQLYECLDTGYKFFYPFNLCGDSNFYQELQKFPWYYMDWKWEHEFTRSRISVGQKVLEIGCGRGAFLEEMNKMGVKGLGLELNEHAIDGANRNDLNILCDTIQNHAKTAPKSYDVVCAFQVLEHVADVKSFIQASIDVLKPGGHLIISVPNDDAGINQGIILNMPPHHMGLWNSVSLANLVTLFPLRLKSIVIEPAQPYHFGFFNGIIFSDVINKYGYLGRIIRRFFKGINYRIIKKLSPSLIGHSIIAVYEKQ